MMKTKLLLLSLLFLLFSCAKGVKTKAVFNLKSLNNISGDLSVISQNGLVIFGTNDLGHRFAKVMNAGDTFDHDLDNGTWIFKAIAWEDPLTNFGTLNATTNTFMGVPNCAIATVPLNGSEVNINLSLKNSTCADPAFGPHFVGSNTGEIQLYGLQDIISCNGAGMTAATSFASDCAYNLPGYISGDTTQVYKGLAASYKILVRPFYAGPSNTVLGSTALESGCLSVSSAATGGAVADANFISADPNISTGFQIPSGPGFEFRVQVFYEDSCAGKFKEVVLGNGLGVNTNMAKTFDNATNMKKLYIKTTAADVCPNTATLSPFAGGNGSVGLPYLICNPRQLNEIYGSGTPPYMTNSFKLLADLNMNLETKEFYSPTYHDDNGNVIDPGRNFKPIGYNEASASGNGFNCTGAIPTAFSGNFDGNNHVIKGLRFDAFEVEDTTGSSFERCTKAGMFASSSGSNFTRLNLENVELDRAASNSGVLVGSATNTQFKEIKMKGVVIRADDAQQSIGALAGNINNSAGEIIQDIEIEDLYISVYANGNSQNIGGMTGFTQSSAVSNIVVKDAIIDSHVDNPGTNEALRVGGIIGNFVTGAGSSFSNAAFYGTVRGDREVGGIVGSTTVTGITDFLVNGLVSASPEASCNAYAGGIVGNGTVAANALFLGKIYYETQTCNAGTVAFAGSISGTAGGGTNSYAVNSVASSTNAGNAGTAVTDANIRNNGTVGGTFITAAGGTWTQIDGDYPRMGHDNNQLCADVVNIAPFASQAGRGTATNPYTICSTAQLDTITSHNPSASYKLLESIVVDNGNFTTQSTFSGSFDGDKHSLIGFEKAFISSNSGTIKNTHFDGISIITASGSASLIESNSGNLLTCRANGGVAKTDTGAGDVSLFVGTNSAGGLISGGRFRVEAVNSTTTGGYISGIAATNAGVIERIEVDANLDLESGAGNLAGGIAGLNSGTIRESKARTRINIINAGTINAGQFAGGVAADNTGTIHDIKIEEMSGQDNLGPIIGNLGFVNGTSSGSSLKIVAIYESADSVLRIDGDGTDDDFDLSEHFIIDGSGGGCYAGTTTACNSTFATLTGTDGWDALLTETSPGVLNPALLSYYAAIIQGQTPPQVAKWEYDDLGGISEDTLRLIRVD